jgi:DNA-directed RNA polymerase specialized sigma24 family protein
VANDSAGSITHFFAELRAGNRAAAEPLCRRFLPRLLGLARQTLAGRPQRASDAEDAVQSALVAFWQQAEAGALAGDLNRDNLWNLLGVMTVRKALRQARRERAAKRGGGRIFAASDLAGDADDSNPGDLAQALAILPTAEFDLCCEELLLSLDEELRQFAVLRLLGHSTAQIAGLLDCTQRKVQRKLELVRLSWEDRMDS